MRLLCKGLGVSLGALGGYCYLHKDDKGSSFAGIHRFAAVTTQAALAAYDYKVKLGPVEKEHGVWSPEALKVRAEVDLKTATRLLRLSEEHGGVYTKMCQYISTLTHILPKEWTETLSHSQDNAPQSDKEDIAAFVREQIGLESSFRKFDLTPIASASIAQVHVAELHSGEKVAVKVIHPTARERFRADLQTVHMLLTIADQLFDFQVSWILKSLISTTRSELQFLNECSNMERVRHMFKDSNVVIPRLYPKLSNQGVITMEFIDGFKITDDARMNSEGVDRDYIANEMFRFFARQVHVHGLVHVDPHPGNILIRRRQKGAVERTISNLGLRWLFYSGRADHELVVLDHGMYRQLSSGFRHNYASLWVSLLCNDRSGAEDACEALGMRRQDVNLMSLLLLHREPSSMSKLGATLSRRELKSLKARAEKRMNMQDLSAIMQRLPPDLFFVSRCVNMVRGNSARLQHGGGARSRMLSEGEAAADGAFIPDFSSVAQPELNGGEADDWHVPLGVLLAPLAAETLSLLSKASFSVKKPVSPPDSQGIPSVERREPELSLDVRLPQAELAGRVALVSSAGPALLDGFLDGFVSPFAPTDTAKVHIETELPESVVSGPTRVLVSYDSTPRSEGGELRYSTLLNDPGQPHATETLMEVPFSGKEDGKKNSSTPLRTFVQLRMNAHMWVLDLTTAFGDQLRLEMTLPQRATHSLRKLEAWMRGWHQGRSHSDALSTLTTVEEARTTSEGVRLSGDALKRLLPSSDSMSVQISALAPALAAPVNVPQPKIIPSPADSTNAPLVIPNTATPNEAPSSTSAGPFAKLASMYLIWKLFLLESAELSRLFGNESYLPPKGLSHHPNFAEMRAGMQTFVKLTDSEVLSLLQAPAGGRSSAPFFLPSFFHRGAETESSSPFGRGYGPDGLGVHGVLPLYDPMLERLRHWGALSLARSLHLESASPSFVARKAKLLHVHFSVAKRDFMIDALVAVLKVKKAVGDVFLGAESSETDERIEEFQGALDLDSVQGNRMMAQTFKN